MIISSFLEKRTAELDKLIADKQKLIELLNEERTAMINQAVTKGLNPNLPMKDTGIEWLGKIPEHWQLSKIKFVCKIIGRIGFRGYTVQDLVKEGEGAISLSPSNIKNHILDISNNCTYLSWMKYEESPEIKIYEKDILVVKTGSTIGKIAIVPKEHPKMTLNPQLIVLKEIKMIPKFLYHIMTSKYFQSYFKIYTAGGSTPAISQEKINNFEIIFPDLVEQEKIVKEVDISITKFHKITEKLNQEIDFLREYKIALISEVVTGKVDVRDEVIGGCHAELVTASALQ
ncbi:EcoKI restriction-modification system protein HsdS [compost metagenome]